MLTVVGALLSGCSSDNTGDEPVPVPSPELALSSDEECVTIGENGRDVLISVDAVGADVWIDVTTNVDAWTLSGDIPSWIAAADKDGRLSVCVAQNESVQPRSAEFTLSVENESGRLEAAISVTQTGVAEAVLELADDAVAIAADGGSVSLAFTTNQPAVSVNNSAEWLSVKPSDSEIVFTADANYGGAVRTAEVTLTAGAGDNTATAVVTVSQEPCFTLSVSTKTLSIAAAGGSATLAYTSNTEVVDIRTDAEWLSFDAGEGEVVFAAEINDTGLLRTAEVILTAGEGDNAVSESVTVSQEPYVKVLAYVIKTSADEKSVGLPTLTSKDETVVITVDYGDGSDAETFDRSVSSADKHTFALAGEYTVTVTTQNVISAFSFSGNTSLYRVANNTLDMSGVTTLARCFYNCTALTEVAANTLTPCVNTASVESMFQNCSSLTAVPAGFFAGLEKITAFNGVFMSCSALASVPAGLFEGYKSVKTFNNVFKGTAIEEIPSRCFAGCSAVQSFNYAFYECVNLKKINVDAFEGCNAVEELYATFNTCSSLTEIPADLLAGMTSLNDLEYCFQHCTALTELPASMFDNNRNLRYFEYCFMNCTALTGESPYMVIDGNKVHLYERKNYPDHCLAPSSYDGCFRNDEGLSDYGLLLQNGWVN